MKIRCWKTYSTYCIIFYALASPFARNLVKHPILQKRRSSVIIKVQKGWYQWSDTPWIRIESRIGRRTSFSSRRHTFVGNDKKGIEREQFRIYWKLRLIKEREVNQWLNPRIQWNNPQPSQWSRWRVEGYFILWRTFQERHAIGMNWFWIAHFLLNFIKNSRNASAFREFCHYILFYCFSYVPNTQNASSISVGLSVWWYRSLMIRLLAFVSKSPLK